MELRSTRQLLAAGETTRSIARLVDAGELVKVGHGHYRSTMWNSEQDRHVAQILAVVNRLPDDAVLSHESAAVLWGLPLPTGPIGRVRTIRGARADGGGRSTPNVRCLRTALPQQHRTCTPIHGLPVPVTTVARTVVELTLQSLPWGVAAGDAALSRNVVTTGELAEVIAELGRRKGIGRARHLVGHLDGRSESVAESLSRVYLAEAGLPAPELQLWVGDDHRRIARIDFAWSRYRVAGECDGLTKYFDPSAGGPHAALRREKRRDGDLIDLGWTPVHWTYPEIFNGAMARRVAQTLMRNGWDGRRD